MRLIIKEKIISLSGKYYIKDREGNDKFLVKGNFALPRKFRIYDAATEKEIIMIKKRMFRFNIFASFRFYVDNREILVAKRKFSIKAKYVIEGEAGNYSINGNILDHDFEIKKDGISIASIFKKVTLYRDSYMIDLEDEFDDQLPQVLGISIMLDHIHHRRNNYNH